MAKAHAIPLPKPLLPLLVWTALVTFVLIVVGAATRVADAGLSCPDWPTCYGQWLPFPAPEGGYVDPSGVQYTTLQVLLEWGHRLLASIVGFMLLAGLFFAHKARKINKRVWRLGIAALVVLLLQIKLGGITVWLDNINWTVALHLGNALVFYSLLIAMISAACRPAIVTPLKAPLLTRILFFASLMMVFLTMLAGAMVSTSHAGGVCGGLFDCAGTWWPSDDHYQQLHMLHRFIASLTMLTLLALVLEAKPRHKGLYKTAKTAFVFALVQAGFGILTLYSFSHYANFYQFLSVVHLAWGTVLLTVLLTGNIKLFWGEKDIAVKIMPLHP